VLIKKGLDCLERQIIAPFTALIGTDSFGRPVPSSDSPWASVFPVFGSSSSADRTGKDKRPAARPHSLTACIPSPLYQLPLASTTRTTLFSQNWFQTVSTLASVLHQRWSSLPSRTTRTLVALRLPRLVFVSLHALPRDTSVDRTIVTE